MRNTPGGRRWRRRGKDGTPAVSQPSGEDADGGPAMADAIQQAIGLLTAGLDSAELERWAMLALTPETPAAMGDFLAGSYMISQLLLLELRDATGEAPAATLQRLAILAESLREMPLTGP